MATVAVIGAGRLRTRYLTQIGIQADLSLYLLSGPQGLVTLKNLREEGFDATIFEGRSSIGGVWQYTEEPGKTSVLQSK